VSKLKKLGASVDQIKLGDILDRSSVENAIVDCQKVILCTSATPCLRLFPKLKYFMKKILRIDSQPKSTELYYRKGKEPYNLDYIGQKNVIDAAVEEKVAYRII
jgi:hypothetical protein